MLWPKGSGASGSPITIGAYGTGALPVVNGGSNEAAIKLFNQEYWHVQDVETTGGTPNGLYISGNAAATFHHLRVTNVVAHDVGGALADKETGLVVVKPNAASTLFDDVVIDGVTAYNTTQWSGIIVGQDAWGRDLDSRRCLSLAQAASLRIC
jgi:hypothetical protein